MKSLLRYLVIGGFIFFATTFSITQGYAAWPSPIQIIEKIGPMAGIDADGIEAAKFYYNKPECATKIISYTAEEDYSLIGFIGALKTMKISSLDALGIPKMNLATCKKLNAVERAYIFINEKGDLLLGKTLANSLRTILEEQIKNGKTELDAQIASIPYVGTIISNWDCGCDAAFSTNFQIEKIVDKTIGLIVSIAADVSKGKLGNALETLITTLWPKAACSVASEWSGVGKIPVVSSIASKACTTVAGKAVWYVIDGASSIAETVGIIWGEHIPLDDYYTKMFKPELAKESYQELADILYGKCYTYYEPTNMSESTAKKACSTLRDRYIRESIGKNQFEKSSLEVYSYYKSNIEPAIIGSAMKNNTDFEATTKAVDAICEKYFSLRYPDQKSYEQAYSSSMAPYSPEFCNYSYKIADTRKHSQLNLINAITTKTIPYCQPSTQEKNVILCAEVWLSRCKEALPTECSTKNWDSEFPCCKWWGKIDSSFQSKMDYANTIAKEVWWSYYCSTVASDPLKVSCGLEWAYLACQKKFQSESNKSCKKMNTVNGIYSDICCDFNPSLLQNVSWVKEAKTFVDEQNSKKTGSCRIGWDLSWISNDPRIITCNQSVSLSCVKKFSKTCTTGASSYVSGICCEATVFETTDSQYDIASRLPEDISLAKKIIQNSAGSCIFGNTKNGVGDEFHIKCTTNDALNMCKVAIGYRRAANSCSKKMTSSGYVSDICCEKITPGISNTPPKSNTPVSTKKGLPKSLPKPEPRKMTLSKKNTAKKVLSGELNFIR